MFLEEQSEVNGEVYFATQSVAGLACRVTSLQTGAAIPIGGASTNTTYTVGDRSGHSVLEFSILQDGKYEFACDYGDHPKGPEVVVAVGSGVAEDVFRTVGLSFVAGFCGMGACLVVVAIVFIRREREKKRIRNLGLAAGQAPASSSIKT